MKVKQSNSRSIVFPLVFSIVAISFSAIFVKWSHAPATILSMYRMGLACLLLAPFAWRKRGDFGKIARTEWYFLIFSGLFLALHYALWFGSLKLTTVASSTIILALQPIIALIGGFFLFKERTTLSRILMMGIAVIGAIMVGWGDFALSQKAITGDFLSFLSVIAVVMYLLIGQRVVKKVSHWIYSFSVFGIAAIFLAFYNLVSGIPLGGYGAREWGIFVLLAVIPNLANVIFNWLLNYVNATTISMSILGEPVGATALSMLFLGETLAGWQIFGGALVLFGVFCFLIQQQRQRPIEQKEAA
ncbi:DMT family transporter [Bacillus salipaludis]|uniref:DMT family transporter n=1 Tax=Bacillus salipaludis TaxID=2547811 RepID=A0A4V3AU76_9BACI|nr:DMT family transporter [Bacillus salipaludis]MDQ6597520.1 DMT family transporter [Bacillus salipaludis]MED1470773.1 DMT family transporter [Bacillus salipaludis]TDK63423.1 DMT family transporter [Bacillus salipaludis]